MPNLVLDLHGGRYAMRAAEQCRFSRSPALSVLPTV